jgi:DNA polymerase-3 subunit alpha
MSEIVDDFVHFHTHSDNSSLDGCGKVSEYVTEAARRGNRALAFTDHGTCRGLMQHHESCGEAEIKPIFGCEFYVSKDMKRKGLTPEERAELTKGAPKNEHRELTKAYEEREGIRDRWHTTVIAKNDIGLRNLWRLSSASFIDGFYYKPRIDIDALIEHGEGLVVMSGCLSSPINDYVLAGKKRAAFEFSDRLSEAFGENFWLEVQPHALKEQVKTNQFILKLRERYGEKHKLLATQDAHYVNRSDAEHHEVLLCIGTGTNLSDPERFKFDGDEFHFRTRKEMFAAFRRHHGDIPAHMVKEALDSTLELSDSCTASIKTDYHATLLPDPGIPAKYKGDSFKYLKDLCLDGWSVREIGVRARRFAVKDGITPAAALETYRARLLRELLAFKKQKFVGYMLMIRDIYRFARDASIMPGPGRGSVGGSLVAYLIGITAVDPIEHHLLFERFISPERIDLPDADCDFEDRRRGDILDYVRSKYGAENVCQIATIGKLSGKEVIRSVSRVLEVPLNEVNQVTSSIIERSSGDERASQTVEDSFKDFDVCRIFNKKYPLVLHHARKLEGMGKTLGIHAAGIVASPVPLSDIIPLEIRKHDEKNVVVSAWDMYGVAAAGLVKIDVLGLRTLTVLKEACEEIERRHGRVIDLESADIDLNDPKVLENFTKHDYGGIFQYDTPSADKVCQGVNFTSFEDVAAMTALNRPGTSRSGLAAKYVERKKNPKLVSKDAHHPAVSRITADTLGIMVYQEHVLRIFTEIAGFAPGTADSLRKVIAKKIGDETLGKEREKFVEGAMKHTPGMTEAIANKIMDEITFFGSYGFNKSHSTAYGMIAFWAQWIKTYYTTEFYWALMKNEPDRLRIQQIAKDAKRHELKLLPPHVSTSKVNFVVDGDACIRGSLVDVKGVGEKAAQAIIDAQPFADMFDFVARVDRRRCNRGAVLALAKAGAFKGMLPNTKWFVENIDEAWSALTSKRKRDTAEKARELLASSAELPDWNEDDATLVSSSVNPLAFGKHPIDAYASTMSRLHVKVADMSAETYFSEYNGKGHFIAGVIVEVKYNQIGDFHTGTLPSEEERKQQFWGARYANVNVEESSGKQNRVKFDWPIFDTNRALIDKGIGTPVLVHVTASEFAQTLRAQFAIDMQQVRERLKKGDELDLWERIVSGDHPARAYPWKDETKVKAILRNEVFYKTGSGFFTGVVTHVQPKYDKRGGLMATFGLIGYGMKYVEPMVFSSVWDEAQSAIHAGSLIRIELVRKPDKFRGGTAVHYEGGQIRILSKK